MQLTQKNTFYHWQYQRKIPSGRGKQRRLKTVRKFPIWPNIKSPMPSLFNHIKLRGLLISRHNREKYRKVRGKHRVGGVKRKKNFLFFFGFSSFFVVVVVVVKRVHTGGLGCLLKAVVDAKVPFSLHYGHYRNDDDQEPAAQQSRAR